MPAMKHEEIVQIVNGDNEPVNTVPRSVMRREGLIHRAGYILVFNSAKELFIQKRTMTKDVFPGYWDIAAGGVVLAGESYLSSARRELLEELGLEADELEYLFDHFYEDASTRVWGRVYRCCHEGPFTLQKEEIEYGRFLRVDRIFELARREPVTPDGLEILHRLMAELKQTE